MQPTEQHAYARRCSACGQPVPSAEVIERSCAHTALSGRQALAQDAFGRGRDQQPSGGAPQPRWQAHPVRRSPSGT
eukprot:6402722-Prymnesium_polylepis.2